MHGTHQGLVSLCLLPPPQVFVLLNHFSLCVEGQEDNGGQAYAFHAVAEEDARGKPTGEQVLSPLVGLDEGDACLGTNLYVEEEVVFDFCV